MDIISSLTVDFNLCAPTFIESCTQISIRNIKVIVSNKTYDLLTLSFSDKYLRYIVTTV